ncbi:MAG: DUF5677 domain-containing protein, partial [Nitrosotalea sp.]
LQKEIKLVLSFSSKNKMDEKHYSDFKSDLRSKFPDFLKIISEIEKLTSIKDMPKYIDKKRKEMEKTGKITASLETIVVTKALEVYVNEHQRLPIGSRAEESLKSIAMKYLESMSQDIMKNLEKDKPRMLREHRKIQDEFEDRLYKRWKEPLDSLESLIVICLESGEDKKRKLSKGKNITNQKKASLIKIHARTVQISYEILALIRGGFADGAHARWRSLHELAIITFFLRDNSDEVSERYLAHNTMKKFKESENYQKHHKALGYPSMTKRELDVLKKEHDRLLQKYGSEFEYGNGFEWIPKTILPKRNFRSLEERAKLDKFHPFYRWASDSVHGGSKGLHRLGLMNDSQNQILAAGPTNYGFADPIHSTAISLSHATSNLLLLEPDFEDILIMKVIQKYIKEVGEKALKVQKKLEEEHRSFMKST